METTTKEYYFTPDGTYGELNQYWNEGGTYAGILDIIRIDTELFTESDWEQIEQASDLARMELATCLAIGHMLTQKT